MKANNQRTQSPELFRNYWGSCNNAPEWIIENRNQFVENFGLIKKIDVSSAAPAFIDHPEAYCCQEGQVVYIIALYEDSADKIDTVEQLGMEVIEKLYDPAAVTLCRVFRSRQAFNAFMQRLNTFVWDESGKSGQINEDEYDILASKAMIRKFFG